MNIQQGMSEKTKQNSKWINELTIVDQDRDEDKDDNGLLFAVSSWLFISSCWFLFTCYWWDYYD